MSAKLIIIRHAERPPIPEGDIGNSLKLTPLGIQQTRDFASRLSTPLLSISSSPVLRCLETAKIIAEENGLYGEEIKHSTLLGDPGFFIENADIAWSHWLEKGSNEVNKHLLSGKDQWSGFCDFEVAINDMQLRIRSMLKESKPGLHIWVTHDTILATFASRVLTTPLSLDDWPDFLGHLTIHLNDIDQLVFNYSVNAHNYN